MKALTVRQPWAAQIVLGLKTIETLRAERAELMWSAYDHLMREPSRDRLGSAV